MIYQIKNIAIAALTLLLLITAAFAWNQKNLKEKAERQTAGSRQVVTQAATIINRYIDGSSRRHAVISADSNQLPHNWYANGIAISGGLVDTVAEALKIAKDKLQQITQVATTTQAAQLKAEKKIDSLQRLTYYYHDRYLQLAYRPADSTGNGQFDFIYNDSLNVVQYWKRNWLLGAKKSYIDIYSNDARTTINGIKRLVVEQKENPFGVRVQAMASYDFSRKLISIGPGLQIDFKRLSLTGSFYYDTDGQLFKPKFTAHYDFVKF
jgi:hypothetical protein